jgi:hypothetical protein
VLLIGTPGPIDEIFGCDEISDTALPFHMDQHRTDQVLGAFADELPDHGARHRWPVERRQHVIERNFKVTEGVHQCAVEVDDARLQPSGLRQIHFHPPYSH